MQKSLGEKTIVARHTQISLRDKSLYPELAPKERCFEPHKNDLGLLSVDNLDILRPEESLATRGAQYKSGNEEFKSINDWELYGLPVGEVCLVDKTISVISSPLVVIPPEKGKPSNPAHCHIDLSNITKQDMPELLVNLRNIAKRNYIELDREKANLLVVIYRKQWDKETDAE